MGQGPGSENRGDRIDNRQDNRGDRQDNISDNRGDRQDNISNNRSDRQDNLGDRNDTRQDRRDNLNDHRAGRIDNVDERRDDRLQRRDQVRDQMRDNYPRASFWSDNPYWARWRWSTPYRWTTWAALSTWGAWGNAANYSYGETVYYQEGNVYYGDTVVASEEEYAEQAQTLAASAPDAEAAAATTSEEDWLPLGVFAVTADGEASGPPPSMYLQLAISKQGIIAGTFYDDTSQKSEVIEGAVDLKTQRTAWGLAGQDWPIMETGLSSLTEDTGPALVHFADGQTQQWLLVRVDDPQAGAAQ